MVQFTAGMAYPWCLAWFITSMKSAPVTTPVLSVVGTDTAAFVMVFLEEDRKDLFDDEIFRWPLMRPPNVAEEAFCVSKEAEDMVVISVTESKACAKRLVRVFASNKCARVRVLKLKMIIPER